MAWDDRGKNPMGMLLPAGLLAMAASPEIRKKVRGALVSGVSGLMDVVEKVESATTGIREDFTGIMAEAERKREEAKGPAIKVEVTEDVAETAAEDNAETPLRETPGL